MSTTKELLNILEDTASLLQKTQVNLKKCAKSRLTKGYIETRIQAIEDYWSTFKNAHNSLVKITPKEQKAILSYFANEEFYIYEDLYLILLADLRDMLNEQNTIAPTTSSQNNTSIATNSDQQNALVRLPRIQLPSFSGKYEEWPTFQDLFTSLVHTNTSISDVQKLHYLKCSVTGEAETLLKHIQVTQKNYEQAWDILKTRYGNKRLIVNSVLKQLVYQKKLSSQSPHLIKSLLDTTTDCLNNLQNLNICLDSWDPIIIFLVVQKLDPESHKDWEQHSYREDVDDLPKWNDLKRFLQSTYRTLELVTPGYQNKATKERAVHVSSTSSPLSGKTCVLCNENHTLCHCKEFTKLQPIERVNYVKANNLCYNCLVPGHSARKCRLQMSCRICKRRHHSLLHHNKEPETSAQETFTQPKTAQPNVEEQREITVNTTVASHHSTRQGIALLATATVTVRNEQNHTVVLRALVDQGSQIALISEKATQMLNLNKRSTRGSIIGVGSTKTNVNHVVQLQIGSRWNANFKIDVEAFVMSKQLTTKLPPRTITADNWPHLEGLNLADSNYDIPGPIDLLLGVKQYSQIVQEKLIKGPPGTPCAQKTYLGWILFGEINKTSQDDSALVLHHQVDMDIMLKSLWEIDTENKRNLTKEEKLCEAIYEETHTRTEEGRYMVKLPLKTPQPTCLEGNTKEIAKNRLLQLERKFRRTPHLKENYKKVMKEYLNYMEAIPEKEIINERVIYLPHHAVVREDKETSKTRVVFDASAKGSNRMSLNDELMVGPQLQEDLRNIIMRWRMKRVCYASDITKMYLQIYVYPEDANKYQRILWRDDEHDSIKEYRLLRVTFGTASAPYLAVKTLHQVADDEGQNYPNAVKIIKENFLVDDLLAGEDTTDQAITSAKEVSHILEKGGFTLSKWSSNCPQFMKSIDTNKRSSVAQRDINKMDGTVKALGLIWNLGTDQFQYQWKLSTTSVNITKRTILSDVQRLFDPLGWIAPSVVMTKMFIQKLWLEKVDWDDIISPELQEEWMTIREEFRNVNSIYIDRWLGTYNTEIRDVQIHGFSDASMKAYSAVAYIRIKSQDGNITTNLIAARTRLAPLKTVSLPRLELCGSLLLSRLLNQIGKAMRISTTQMFAWTDSTIVIAWLSGAPHKWKTFVANRVAEITENLNNNQWYHVASEDNPADIASRGMLITELKQSELWWKGPKWLSERKIILKQPDVVVTDLEQKRDKIQINIKIQNEEEHNFTTKFKQFDNLQELLKVITYCRRFVNHIRKLDTYENCKSLTTEELHTSLIKCIKLVQKEEFTDEINRLKINKNVKKNSNIKTLTPYLDQDGILRVGGRLRHASLDEKSKHPIILGHDNNLTPLLIADAHAQTLHGGVQLMLCVLRSKYWIIRAKGLIKNFNRKCLVCAKQRASTRTQIMGDLPKERVTPTRAFLHSGVDYAGPFQILMSRGRGMKTQKAYIALFVCMSTKAIHLELVGDLTSEGFIAAYKRFVSRRGKCSHMWSDQGRNFVGAEKDLSAAWQEANLNFEKDIAHKLALEGTQWHFIPAYSPNFGGLWEAGVKSLKTHLKRVLTTNLTFEEMTTILCQIEACLNSRPLCPIDDSDADSIEPLTPGHFLIHEAPIVVPSPDFKDTNIHNLTRWQYTQKLVGDIWRRWHCEYLTSLQQRPIWHNKKQEFSVGDIVLIKTEGIPAGKWLLGRIVDKHPGHDGITRVYSVKSGNSIVKRSVTKLCPLPVDTD